MNSSSTEAPTQNVCDARIENGMVTFHRIDPPLTHDLVISFVCQ
jgi:hypothetical protein